MHPPGQSGDREVATPHGTARYRLDVPAKPNGVLLVLGHGAGGDVNAADLVAVHDAALAAGVAVALVTQPYRVAGRRAPAPAAQLDVAWLAVLADIRRTLQTGPREGGPVERLEAGPGGGGGRLNVSRLVVGGRSSGARVACRTARAGGADGVLALAFPLHPPGRPEKSRDEELDTRIPTLVINGDRDAFGVPPARAGVRVHVLPGETHALSRHPAAVAAAAVEFVVAG